ncbi:MAG: four helix bundle protein [Deltaproteobacteria bacterium]|nr:four helix bundle protein [Deltaproteobacteria bacterium]
MNHEHTRIYLLALDIVSDAAALTQTLPAGYGFLADQLRRAASSVALNFSEGSKHSSLRERRRFFTIARGSAAEVSAIIDVAHRFGIVESALGSAIKDRCDHVCAMLRLYR